MGCPPLTVSRSSTQLIPAGSSPLADEGWFALYTIIDETVVRELIPDLMQAGAQGIVEYSLNKVLP